MRISLPAIAGLLIGLTPAAPGCAGESSSGGPAPTTGATMETTLSALVGRPLSEAVAGLKLTEDRFAYRDEPPGKLRGITVTLGASEELEVHLRYDAGVLFSEERKWPLARIGAAEVVGFVWRRGKDTRRIGAASGALGGR